jgi:16S rRNA (adenine1518-N6/adenine1519-N6)-dimethyltransferase
VTHSPADITRLLQQYGLAPRRAFGQNFVADANTVRRIAALSGVGPGDHVVEIGAGLGSLTLALAETGATIVAVEIDNGLVNALRDVVSSIPNIEVVHADAASLDWHALGERSPRWHVVANLPYNIATPLVADILDDVPVVEHLLVMVQREVAERFVAEVGSDAYGAVSVKIAYWAKARIVGDVPPSVFIPKPSIMSTLVDIRRHATPAVDDIDPRALFALVRKGFAQRRKMLRRALAGTVTSDDFETAGIAPESRAEELDVHAWGRLLSAIESRS